MEKRVDTKPLTLPGQKRFKLISCEVLAREFHLAIAEGRHVVDVEFLRKGLHDAGQKKMAAEIQKTIDEVDTDQYDAILMGYGRCNDGVVGLTAPAIPLVIPRGHDCITLFFGSQESYASYFSENPGCYYRTTGWMERDDYGEDSVMTQLGLDKTYEEYVAQYGEVNAKYIMESMGDWVQNYERISYIEMGLPLDKDYIELAQEEARVKKLEFNRIKGNMRLFEQLVAGDWCEMEFLVVRPGERIVSDDEGCVIRSVSP
ncbi:MAG: DUF1638 domain-containing protein [Phycisphaerae bacterium]|nr:DUF1638 domain-containing protein [Phycisphaerae bacterium]